MAEGAVQFLRHGKRVTHHMPDPMQTVLDYVRLEEKRKGTKEGCNEGDCGACTVAIGSLKNGALVYEPANACILLMGQLEGKELVTIEDLTPGGTLHPLQQAMVDLHGSQCGFCTSGIVMSLFTLYHGATTPSRQSLEDALAGNLCRCTGYRPIFEAATKAMHGARNDPFIKRRAETLSHLKAMAERGDVFVGDANSFAAIPKSEATLLRLVDEHRDAVIVSGATDVGLWITKQLRVLPKLIFTHGVQSLHGVTRHDNHITIGAAATYVEATEALSSLHDDVAEVVRRIGSVQVRCSGTIGGNIANGSPIGDTPPLLIALGATLTLKSTHGERSMPLEEYFIAYGKQDRAPGEMVWSISIPKLKPQQTFRAYKISKRFDQDISAVMAAFRFDLEGRKLKTARLAFGGMAATPKRASHVEAKLEGVDIGDEVAWQSAVTALVEDFQPISDMRATASYRMSVAQNLLLKARMELADTPTATRVMALA